MLWKSVINTFHWSTHSSHSPFLEEFCCKLLSCLGFLSWLFEVSFIVWVYSPRFRFKCKVHHACISSAKTKCYFTKDISFFFKGWLKVTLSSPSKKVRSLCHSTFSLKPRGLNWADSGSCWKVSTVRKPKYVYSSLFMRPRKWWSFRF